MNTFFKGRRGLILNWWKFFKGRWGLILKVDLTKNEKSFIGPSEFLEIWEVGAWKLLVFQSFQGFGGLLFQFGSRENMYVNWSMKINVLAPYL